VLEEDEVTRTNGGRDVGDSEVVAVHVVHANRYSDHAGIVPPGHAPYLVAKRPRHGGPACLNACWTESHERRNFHDVESRLTIWITPPMPRLSI
jgi:hypothetical protein